MTQWVIFADTTVSYFPRNPSFRSRSQLHPTDAAQPVQAADPEVQVAAVPALDPVETSPPASTEQEVADEPGTGLEAPDAAHSAKDQQANATGTTLRVSGAEVGRQLFVDGARIGMALRGGPVAVGEHIVIVANASVTPPVCVRAIVTVPQAGLVVPWSSFEPVECKPRILEGLRP